LKILLLSHKFWPSVGGTQKLCYGIAEGLVAKGHEVTVMTSATKSTVQEEWRDGIRIKRFERASIGTNRPWCVTPGMARASLAVSRQDYDIVHAFHFITFQALLGASMRGLRSARFVLTPSYHPWNGPYERTLGTMVMRRAHVVVAQCEQEKGRLSSFVDASKIQTIPCGIDEGSFSRPNKHDVRDVFGFSKGDKVILYVGDVGGRKSVSQLISLMPAIVNKVDNAKLLVVGGGLGHEALRELASSYGVADKVVIAGQLSEEMTLSAYASSDAFAFPSEHESFGIVLVEAAAAGLPIVSTRVGVAPEVIVEGFNGYSCGACDQEFADRLIEVISDGAFKGNARALRTGIVRKYGWTAVTNSLDSLYRKLAGQPVPEAMIYEEVAATIG
jgi:glycosyltransferase involved in cell wall biosynthesis